MVKVTIAIAISPTAQTPIMSAKQTVVLRPRISKIILKLSLTVPKAPITAQSHADLTTSLLETSTLFTLSATILAKSVPATRVTSNSMRTQTPTVHSLLKRHII